MRIPNRLVTLFLLPAFLVTTTAFAQQSRVVDAALMNEALAQKATSESAQRDLVRRVLDRSDARELAARMGLSVERAGSAVQTLSSAELATLAQHATAVEANALAGGAGNTIVISLTTALLILIIVILLVK
jgi:hypothetical protein